MTALFAVLLGLLALLLMTLFGVVPEGEIGREEGW